MEQFPEDIDLISKLRNDDVDAYDQIYKKYSLKLYLFAHRYLKSTVEAEELVQSVFLKIWEKHRNLKIELSFKSYLFSIAYNDICKLFRKRQYHLKYVTEAIYEHPTVSPVTEERIDYKIVLNRIEQILNELPEKRNLVFRKSRYEGMSTKEIAEELRLSPGTVDNYISETTKLLKTRLQGEGVVLL